MNEMNTINEVQATPMWQPIPASSLNQEKLRQFLAERCHPDPRGSVRANRMFQEYKNWCYSRNEIPVRIRLFADAMHEAGVAQSMAQGRKYWRGISLVGEEKEMN